MSDPPPLALRLAAHVARAARPAGAVRTLLLALDVAFARARTTGEEERVSDAADAALDTLQGHGWLVAIVSDRPSVDFGELVGLSGIHRFGSREPRDHAASAAGATAPWPSHTWHARLGRLLRDGAAPGLEVRHRCAVSGLRSRGPGTETFVAREFTIVRPPRRDDSLVGIGDERSERGLFDALDGIGLSVKVGSRLEPTRARSRLPSTRAVERFLCELARIVGIRDERR